MTLFVKNPNCPGFTACFESAQTWHAVNHDDDGNVLVHFDSVAKAKIAQGLVQAVLGDVNDMPQVSLLLDEAPGLPEKYRVPVIVRFPARFASFC